MNSGHSKYFSQQFERAHVLESKQIV